MIGPVTGGTSEGLRVWAAYGAPDWPALGCSASAFPHQRMQEVLDFGAAHPATPFGGVMLDVEPPEPQGAGDFQDLLDLYACLRDALAAGGADSAVAIRFFWDAAVTWHGATRAVYEHVLGLGLDHVVVMGYRDTAGSPCAGAEPDGVICLDEDEVAHATAEGLVGAVLVGLETGDCAPGCGPEKVTFFEEGQDALLDQAALVAAHFAASAGFGGFSIHRYDAAYLGGSADWPDTNPAWAHPPVPSVGRAAGALLGAALLASAWWRRRAR